MSGEKAEAPRPWPAEIARLGVLAAVAAWLLHPFVTKRLYRACDALKPFGRE